MSQLFQLHADIDERVRRIRAGQPDWPCAKGCDTCCRRLADIPQLSAAEWALLQEGLAALTADHRQALRRKVAALAGTPEGAARPVVCPLLDTDSGACPVYAQRPAACRTYGFYVQREAGLYCGEIEARVAGGELAEVVWGNHEAVERALTALGERRSLVDWFARADCGVKTLADAP